MICVDRFNATHALWLSSAQPIRARGSVTARPAICSARSWAARTSLAPIWCKSPTSRTAGRTGRVLRKLTVIMCPVPTVSPLEPAQCFPGQSSVNPEFRFWRRWRWAWWHVETTRPQVMSNVAHCRHVCQAVSAYLTRSLPVQLLELVVRSCTT